MVFTLLAASTLAGVAFKHPLPFQRGDMVSLEIVVPGDVLAGRGMGGWGRVWITYPGGYLYASIPLDGRDRSVKFTFNLTEAKARAHRVLARLAELGSVEYATLHFTAYIVKDDGSKCIATFTYSTLDYYRDQTPLPGKAERLARANPLALLEAGRLTVKKERMTDCMPFTTPLEKAAEGFTPTGIRVKPAELAPTTTKLDRWDPTSLGVGVESVNPPPPSTPSCPLSFAEVVFPNLYNQRYSPPDPWLDRVALDPCCEGDRQKIVGDLWYQFATLLSMAYYYPSWCSASSALYSTAYYTRLPEGVHTMENVVYRMAEITGWDSVVKGWQNEHFPGDTFKLYDKAPIARIEMHYYGQQYPPTPEYGIHIIFVDLSAEYVGVTLKGIPAFSHVRDHIDVKSNSTSVVPYLGDVSVGFIYAPLYAIYEFDGLIVEYHVGKTVVNGVEYWRVVPLFYYAPIYTFDYDYNVMNNIAGNPNDPVVGSLIKELNEVFFNLSSLLGYNNRSYYTEWINVNTSELGPTPFRVEEVIDSNEVDTVTMTDLGWYLTFLANLAIYVAKIFSGLDSGFFKLSTLADPLIGVTWIQVNSEEFVTKLVVVTDKSTPVVSVDVDKLSIEPSFLTDYYSSLGKFPPLYTYRVVVVER